MPCPYSLILKYWVYFERGFSGTAVVSQRACWRALFSFPAFPIFILNCTERPIILKPERQRWNFVVSYFSRVLYRNWTPVAAPRAFFEIANCLGVAKRSHRRSLVRIDI